MSIIKRFTADEATTTERDTTTTPAVTSTTGMNCACLPHSCIQGASETWQMVTVFKRCSVQLAYLGKRGGISGFL